MNFKEIVKIIKHRCKPDDSYSLSRVQRWFYTLKCLICLLLNRHGDLWGKDHVDVAVLRSYSHYDWISVVVGHGYFKNWYYDKYRESSY